MRFLYRSASNMAGMNGTGTSYKICAAAKRAAQEIHADGAHSILELKNRHLIPCVGCGSCRTSHRCAADDDFNAIYTQIIHSDVLLLVSPHYAPIPSKLAALLEKMEQITFLCWGADHSYQSEVYGKPTGVISHGGGSEWALKRYQHMINDTIANAMDTIQMKIIPFNEEWNIGISLPVSHTVFSGDSVFPVQEYDWDLLTKSITAYMDVILNHV